MGVESEITEAAVTAAVAEVKAETAEAIASENANDLAAVIDRIGGIERRIDDMMNRMSSGYDDTALRAELAAMRAELDAMTADIEDAEDEVDEAVEEAAVMGAVAGGLVAEDVATEAVADPVTGAVEEKQEEAPEERRQRKRHFLK
jgi:Skp family chaperone for outer membrane proteins